MRRKKCPDCNSKKTIPIIYGLPTAKAEKEAEKGLIKLGGCWVDVNNPQWYCKNCGHVF